MLTDEHKKMRQGKMTSSLVPAALGYCKHRTPLQAWLTITGQIDDSADNKATERGNMLEPAILQWMAGQLQGKLAASYECPPFASIEPWAGDSADAVFDDGSIGEAKSASLGASTEWGEEGTDQVPMTCLIQSCWHLIHHPSAPVCWAPVLIGGYQFEFRKYCIPRNNRLLDTIWVKAQKWYEQHVVAGNPPPASAGDNDFLDTMNGDHKAGQWALANPNLVAQIRRKQELATERKVIELEEKALRASIVQELGGTEGTKGDWGKAYYRRAKGRAVVDWKAIVNEIGAPDDIIEKHTTVRPGARTLRIYLNKGK